MANCSAEHSRAYREKLEEVLEEGIVEGLIRSDIDPAAEAVAFVGTLRGVVGQWMAAPHGFDLEAVRSSMKQSPWDHLAPRE